MLKHKIYIIFFILAISCLFAVDVYNDILYYPELEAPQPNKNKLDIYVPDGLTEAAPVFFFVHGGTWMYGDRSDYAPLGDIIAGEEGYVTVIISYRLSDSLHPDVSHPDHIRDVAQAFKWTVDNIVSYNGNTEEIFVCGHSAGAHLISLLATNTTYLENAGASESDIAGAISFSMGIYDIPGLYHDLGSWADMLWPYTPFAQIFTDDTLNWYDASPKYHLHTGMAPFVFFVAENDMEHIIGGDWGGYGLVYLDGEVGDCYEDFNDYQDADTFWIEGDHETSFANFAYESSSRARVKTINFIEETLEKVEEKDSQNPTKLGINIFPNPFNSACNLELSEAESISIYNNKGRLIETFIASKATWIPKENIPSGEYIVVFEKRAKLYSRKLHYIK